MVDEISTTAQHCIYFIGAEELIARLCFNLSFVHHDNDSEALRGSPTKYMLYVSSKLKTKIKIKFDQNETSNTWNTLPEKRVFSKNNKNCRKSMRCCTNL